MKTSFMPLGKGDRGLCPGPEGMEGNLLDRRGPDHRPQPAHHRHHLGQAERLHCRQQRFISQ
jgi:hypothetical protein